MTTVEKSIDVEVPISTAYNQWTQFEEFPEFMGGVESITQTDASHLHWSVSIGGIAREFDAEITEQHLDERIAWRSTGGQLHAGVVTFHQLAPDRTRVTVQMDWTPDGLVEQLGAVVQADDAQVASDLKKFKELIENQGVEDGSWRGDIDRS